MNSRGLIVAVVVLAALAGVLYWSQHRKPPEESAAVSANTAPVILKVNTARRNRARDQAQGHRSSHAQKDGGGKWQITEPKPYPADQEAVAGVLSTLSALNADRVVEDKASDRKQYGLDAPAVELDITGKGHGVAAAAAGRRHAGGWGCLRRAGRRSQGFHHRQL